MAESVPSQTLDAHANTSRLEIELLELRLRATDVTIKDWPLYRHRASVEVERFPPQRKPSPYASSSLTASVFLTKANWTCSMRPSRCSHRKSSRWSKPRPIVLTSRNQQPQKLRQRERYGKKESSLNPPFRPRIRLGPLCVSNDRQIAPIDTPSVSPGPSSRLVAGPQAVCAAEDVPPSARSRCPLRCL